MLGKLMKYELRATARVFLPMYAAILMVSILSSISVSFQFEKTAVTVMAVLFGLFVALVVLTISLTFSRFYKNLLGDEGYLMNTLPVQVDSIILSKFFTMVMWLVGSTVTAMVSAFIMLIPAVGAGEMFSQMGRFFSEMWRQFAQVNVRGGVGLLIILLVLSMFMSVALQIFQAYFAMSISQLQPFSGHRIPAAIICYVGLNWIISIVVGLSIMPDTSFNFGNSHQMLVPGNINISLFLALLVNVAICSAFYFGTRYVLNNKMNLE